MKLIKYPNQKINLIGRNVFLAIPAYFLSFIVTCLLLIFTGRFLCADFSCVALVLFIPQVAALTSIPLGILFYLFLKKRKLVINKNWAIIFTLVVIVVFLQYLQKYF